MPADITRFIARLDDEDRTIADRRDVSTG